MQEISPEIIGKYKQLCRLLISYNDFKHASDVAHLYVNGDYEVDRVEWDGDDYFEKRTIGEALNCAMIVAYARPFSGNDKAASFKIPDLPKRYFRQLVEKGRQAHELIIERRNFQMAHSDSRAWELVPQVLEIGKAHSSGKRILPLVLTEGLHLPGFISGLKYIPVYKNLEDAMTKAKRIILDQLQIKQAALEKKKQNDTLVLIGIGAFLLWAFSQK